MATALRNLLQRTAKIDTNVLLLRFTGLIALLNVPSRHIAHRASDLVAFNLTTVSRYTSLLIGISLLYLATQVARKKQSAFWITVSALTLLISAESLHARRSPLLLLVYAATLFTLLLQRRSFVVRSDLTSVRRATITAGSIFGALVLFAAVSVEVISQRYLGDELSFSTTLTILYRGILGLPLAHTVHLTKFGSHLVHLLHVAAISGALLIGYSLFQPLRLRRPAPRYQRRNAERLTKLYSTSSEDFFKLWPADKHYFFYRESFLAYGVRQGVAYVLDGPTGKAEDCSYIRQAFLDESHRNGWLVCILHADEQESKQWQNLGLQSLFIGSEAVISVPEFVETTVRNKHFRYVKNKAAKDELVFAYWQAPLTNDQLTQLEAISNAWLNGSSRREYSFIMGYFNRGYLRRCNVGVLTKHGVPVAYANLIPSYVEHVASIDHMRMKPRTSPVGMHYLLMELIKRQAEDGAHTFNVGLAPLSMIQEQAEPGIAKSFLSVIKNVSSRYYSVSGVEQFKGKFEPDWQPRYLLYSGSALRLPAVAAGLSALTAYRETAWTRLQKLLLATVLVAAICNSTFPLAYALNRPYFWHGLVSGLAEQGQPYNWLFAGLDMLSSLLAAIAFIYLYRHLKQLGHLYRAVLALVVIGSLGELLTDIFLLPPNFKTTSHPSIHTLLAQPIIIGHGLASIVNSLSFVTAFGLWIYYLQRRGKGNIFRTGLFVITILIGTVGSVIGSTYQSTSPSLQRAFIVSYSLWLLLLGLEAIKQLPTRKTNTFE